MKIADFNSRMGKMIKNPLFMVAVITTVLTIFLLEKQVFLGVPYYDVFVYLNNALIYAGVPVGNMSVIYLSPLMPFLTSLIFRLGYVSANVLFLLNGLIFIIGVISLYLIFRERFNDIESFTGVLIFLSFPLTLAWAVSGGIDFPGVSLSVLTIYILIVGVNKSSKLLYLVFPLFIMAFLARYTSAVLIFPIILYLVLNKDISGHLKKLSMGILASLAVLSPFFFYILYKLGNFNPLLNIFTSTLLGSGATVNDLGYNPVKLYFLNNILKYISVGPLNGIYGIFQSPSRGDPTIFSYLIAAVVLIGLGLYLYSGLKNKVKNSSYTHKTIFKFILLVILSIVGVYFFFTASYLLTELIFIAILYVAYQSINDRLNKDLRIDFLFLAWLGAFFIFHSMIPLKEDRYFITMLPAVTYFIIMGLRSFIEKFSYLFKNQKIKTAIYLFIGVLLLSYSTVAYVGHVTQEGYGFYMQYSCNWLTSYDAHYQDRVIYSNYDPAATWCLKKEVKFGVPRLYVNLEAFSNYLRAGEADYYIDAYSTNPHIPGYRIIHSFETITIYEREW